EYLDDVRVARRARVDVGLVVARDLDDVLAQLHAQAGQRDVRRGEVAGHALADRDVDLLPTQVEYEGLHGPGRQVGDRVARIGRSRHAVVAAHAMRVEDRRQRQVPGYAADGGVAVVERDALVARHVEVGGAALYGLGGAGLDLGGLGAILVAAAAEALLARAAADPDRLAGHRHGELVEHLHVHGHVRGHDGRKRAVLVDGPLAIARIAVELGGPEHVGEAFLGREAFHQPDLEDVNTRRGAGQLREDRRVAYVERAHHELGPADGRARNRRLGPLHDRTRQHIPVLGIVVN